MNKRFDELFSQIAQAILYIAFVVMVVLSLSWTMDYQPWP